jgi:N-acetylmuramoyl-L-alanine amidase
MKKYLGPMLWVLPLGLWIVVAVGTLWYLKEDRQEPVIEPEVEVEEQKIEEPSVFEREIFTVQNEPEVSTDDVECLALNIYHEARSDNFAGQIAVADVVLNRIESGRFPDTVCDVVKQARTRVNWKGNVVPVKNACQFSWYCDGLDDEPFEEHAWIKARMLAKKSLTNEDFRGITEGSTHYHATYVTPDWVNDRGMQSVGQIGQHKFYRWQ